MAEAPAADRPTVISLTIITPSLTLNIYVQPFQRSRRINLGFVPTSILPQPTGYGLHPIKAGYNKNMLKYKQTIGGLFQLVDGAWVFIGTGYSGNGAGLNAHAHENEANVGPVPCGLWSLGHPYKDDHRGENCFRLVAQTYFGTRNGFLIHGDNEKLDHSASDGCIILGPAIRLKLVEIKPMYLLVEA